MVFTYLNDAIRVFDVPDCYFCGTPGLVLYEKLGDRIFGVPGTWTFRRCPNCSLVWLDPRPEAAEIPKLYPSGYYTHGDRFGCSRLRAILDSLVSRLVILSRPTGRRRISRLAAEMFRRISPSRNALPAEIRRLYDAPNGRLLDVGCGDGALLLLMKRAGWLVQGVEPDPIAAAIARNSHGLAVTCSALEEAPFPDQSFDVVTVSHVIEHVNDPIGLIRECWRVLKENGQLVVITPNTKSLGRRLFGLSWWPWDPPRHLMLFFPRLLAECAARAGIGGAQIRTSARAARIVWQVSRLLSRSRTLEGTDAMKFPLSLKLQGFLFWTVEYPLSKGFQLGEEVVLVATKREADRQTD